MTTRNANEILTIIDSVEAGFDPLWRRNDAIEAYLNNLVSIADELPDHLDSLEELATFDPYYDLTILANKVNRPLEHRITPHSRLKSHRQQADRIEDWESNRLVKMGLQNGGWEYASICQRIFTDCYVPLWLEFDAYEMPEKHRGESDADFRLRREQYQREWWGVRPVLDPVRTTAFMARGRDINTATRRYRIPAIDLLRYTNIDIDDDPERPAGEAYQARLALVGQEFNYLRASDNESEWAQDPSNWGEWVEVIEIHDGPVITHAIRTNSLGGRDGAANYEEVGSYDNPLGRPALFIATGKYTSGAPLHRRYLPGALPLMQAYRNRDRLRSYLLSLMASAKKNNIVLEPDAITAWANLSQELRDAFMKDEEELGFKFLPGKPEDITTIEHQWELARIQLESVENDIQRMRPSAVLTNNPDAAGSVGATATTILTLAEEEEIPLQGIQTELVNLCKEVLESIQTMFVHSINAHYDGKTQERHRSPEDMEADAYFYAAVDGQEWVHGRTPEGGDVILKPSDYAMSFTRQLTSLDLSLSTMTARRQEADAKWFTPDNVKTITWDARLEAHGHRNVSKAKQELWEDRIFQREIPRLDAAIAAQADRWAEVFLGMAPGTLAATEAPPELPPGATGGGGGGPGEVRHMVDVPARQRPQGTAVGVQG